MRKRSLGGALRGALRGGLVGLALSGCAAGGAGGLGGLAGAPPAASYHASRSGAAYAPPAALAEYYAAAQRAGATAGRTLEADEALAATASDVARRVANDAQGRAPSVRVVQALAWSRGAIDPVPALAVLRASAGAVAAQELEAQAAALLRAQEFNRVGLATAPTRDGGAVLVLACAQRRVTLTREVPRRLAAGARVVLSGRIADGLTSPELALTTPEGRSETLPMGEGPDFLVNVPVPRRGVWQLEVLGQGSSGVTVLANFPVYVDTDVPATPEEVAAPRTDNAEAAEAEFVQLLNEARATAGLRPLVAMPALAAVARAHSADMAQARFFAHVSPTTGAPAERVRRAGLQSGLVLENLGRGYNAREMHLGLMESPGHRANIMNERATHVGVGVAVEQGPSGSLLLTQNFIEVAAAVDLSAAPARLLEAVNSARGRRGVPALDARAQLAEVANATAQEYFRSPRASQQEIVDRANRQLSRLGLLYRRVSVLATRVSRLEEAAMLEPLMEAEIRAAGIGVAQGTRPGDPPNSLFVVYVVGYPR